MNYRSGKVGFGVVLTFFLKWTTLLLLLTPLAMEKVVVDASGHSTEEDISMSGSSRILTVASMDREPSVASPSSSSSLSPSSSSSGSFRIKPERHTQTHYHHQVVHPMIAHPPISPPSPPYYSHSRPGRHLGLGSSFSPTNLLGLGSGSNYGYAAPEFGEPHVAASSGGASYGTPSYGWPGNNCNSALGLFGVLGLASYLQNVLRQMTTTTAATGRRKRSNTYSNINELENEDVYEKGQNPRESDSDNVRITKMVLPLLTAVAHARDGLISPHCVHRPICTANEMLVEELGESGSGIGSLITTAVGNLLHPLVPKYKEREHDHEKEKIQEGNTKSTADPQVPDHDRHSLLLEAGKTGRVRVKDDDGQGKCDKYEHCDRLNSLPTYGLPPGGLTL